MKNKIVRFCDCIIEYCLYFLIFCLPFTKAGMQVFCWLAILSWLVKKIVSLQMPIKNPFLSTILNKPLLAFIAICTLSTILSVNFDLSLEALLTKVVKNVILFFMVVETINTKRRLKNVLMVIIMSVSLIVIDAGVQYFRGRDFLRGFTTLGPGFRLRASFSSPNGFGGWIAVIMPILLGAISNNQFFRGIIKKIGIAGLILLLLICLGMTRSRGSWIGFMLSLGAICCYLIHLLNHRFKIVVIPIMILSLVGLSFILPQTTKERIASIVRIEDSSLFRISLWKESMQIIEDFPLSGVGLNTYSKVAPEYSKGEGGYYPHNSYLHMASEIGVTGLICFFWIIISLFKFGLYTLKRTKDSLLLGLLAGILAFLGQSFFDVNLYALQLATLFWFTLGITIARINLLQNSTNAL